MEQLLLPNQIEFIKEKDIRRASFVISPCHPGYGTTIGNALRRVLLSSLPGAAVTAMKIEGVNHEFGSIANIKEDIVQIILNLKQLRLKVHSSEPVRLTLEAKGEREVHAGDITPNAEVEIANPDLLVATLTSKEAELKMEIFVRQGRGYLPIEERAEEEHEIGAIAIDSVFTPVRSVGYRVEDMRVGQKINYDKLTLNIETDGTILPREAVEQASKILVDHFDLLTQIKDAKSSTLSAKQSVSASKDAGAEGITADIPDAAKGDTADTGSDDNADSDDESAGRPEAVAQQESSAAPSAGENADNAEK